MPDYNIYLHAAVTTGSRSSPTTPWSQKEGGGSPQTTSENASNGGGISFSRAASFAQNPDSVVSASFGALAKALPWVAAAVAAVKIGSTIADNVFEFNEIESGDYRNGNLYREYKTLISMCFRPVSTVIEHLKLEKQIKRDTERAKLTQDLLGGSIVNSYTRRGV